MESKPASRAPLSELFLGVYTLLSQKKYPIFVATISFAMLLAAGSAAVQFHVAYIEDKLMTQYSLDSEALRIRLDADLQAISVMDAREFMESSGIRFGGPELQSAPTGEHVLGLAYMLQMAPVILLQLLFDITTMFVAAVFFLILFSQGSKSAYEAAQRLPKIIFPMCAQLFWILVRSFLWIPIVGPIIAMYMLPRLCLAPVILASGEAGIVQSARLSMKRTSRHWFSLVLRLVLIAIVACLILWPMLVLVVGVTLLSYKLGYLLLLCCTVFIIAFLSAALTVLSVMMA